MDMKTLSLSHAHHISILWNVVSGERERERGRYDTHIVIDEDLRYNGSMH